MSQISVMENTKNTISGAKGITFTGETFVVPETHDMVKTLFDPTIRKSYAEILILFLLSTNGLVFWFVKQNSLRIYIFIGLYLCWRSAYNFGIGYLLHHQSKYHGLVKIAKNLQLFKDTENPNWLQSIVAKEIKSQMGSSYPISKYPIDFNTWLIFRKIVDLILMSDFTTFVCLVIACSISNDYQFINFNQQSLFVVVSRLFIGTSFILFNLWVKVNAHNTIKDYAWYWGDFFFRQINNEDLIFDGVFEMFPHPMYSVGYIGYYGFALISKSYTVLIVSLLGHFLQMIFLHYIENPHIDKIYGTSGDAELQKLNNLKDLTNFDNVKPMVGLNNFSWMRSSDLLTLILSITYAIIIPYCTSFASNAGNTQKYSSYNPSFLVFILTVGVKIFESFSINSLLVLQSYYKTFTKFCLSNDIPVEESLNNWSVLYNSLTVLTYSSFFGLNFYKFLVGVKESEMLINDWFHLRLFLGLLSIITQFWINSSIIDSIGYFGWFYGDFFIPRSLAPQRSHLTKAGIYRYLNNPEQLFGVCGVMGATMIFPTWENVICCLLWVCNNFIRINFIEKLHMIKVYGEQQVLQDSGVTKTFKKHLIPKVISRRLSNETSFPRRKSSIFNTDSIEQFLKDLKRSDDTNKIQEIRELAQNIQFTNSQYELKIGNFSQSVGTGDISKIEIGVPLIVNWSAPDNHSSKDWIGLYKVAQTTYARNKTLISSAGRWFYTVGESGQLIFSYDKLFWEEGIYEFRYHIDGKHDVACISQPFEIKASKINVPSSMEGLKEFAINLKNQVFDRVMKTNLESIESNIIENIEKNGDYLTTIERLASMISIETDIKISSKIFLKDDRDNRLNILLLSKKLIKIKKALEELSYKDVDITFERKND